MLQSGLTPNRWHGLGSGPLLGGRVAFTVNHGAGGAGERFACPGPTPDRLWSRPVGSKIAVNLMQLLPRIPRDELPSEIRKAIRIIEEDYRKTLRLEDAAEAVGLSPFHFSRMFHTSTGFTFQEYVIRVRLQHACRLLRDPAGPAVTRIALDVGLGSLRNLERLFHDRIGVSPSEFRGRSAGSDGSC